jgi:hypothetical protein
VTNDGGPPDSEPEPFGSLPEGPGDAAGTGDDLDDLDDDEDGDAGQQTALPPKVEAWRRRSATGAVLTGFALGLQQALGKEQEQPAIVMQTAGDPPTDLPVEAEVEQGRPRQSVVNIRPWLLPNRAEETEPDAGRGTPDPAPGTEDA